MDTIGCCVIAGLYNHNRGRQIGDPYRCDSKFGSGCKIAHAM